MELMDSAALACLRSIGKAFVEGMALYGATMYGCIAELETSRNPARGQENGGSPADRLANPENKNDDSNRLGLRLVTSARSGRNTS
jgi:hypothetical protein